MLTTRQQVFTNVIGHRYQVVKEWLHCSGTCPLSISLHYSTGYICPISDVDFYNFSQHYHSLITSEVEIEKSRDYEQGPCHPQPT